MNKPTTKQMIAFKIGARARKFAVEGCVIEGYEVLYAALAEAKEADPELHALLTVEMEKYEQRVAAMEEEDAL
ncbi:MAG TPA: hypothetical protein VFB21_09800 [Chthonomonadaceae bacterium]|nr:hypothetical protein [Chthonomonadaceae bacterium]